MACLSPLAHDLNPRKARMLHQAPIHESPPYSSGKKEHSKKRCFLFLILFLLSTHLVSPLKRHLSILSFVDNLFNMASQPMKTCFGMALEYRINLHQLTSASFSLMATNVSAQEYKPYLEGIQIGVSSSAKSIKHNLLWIGTRLLDLAGGQIQLPSCNTLDKRAL